MEGVSQQFSEANALTDLRERTAWNAGVARDESRLSLEVRFTVRRADAMTPRRSVAAAMARDVLPFGWEKARRKAVVTNAKNVPGGESSLSDPSSSGR